MLVAICLTAEKEITHLIGLEKIEIVNLGEDQSKIEEAKKAGVKSVPVLVTPTNNVLHINFGASLEDL